MAILETKNLSKAFGALAAVDGVSLAIEAGSLHSIIGPNGAGKTTLSIFSPGPPARARGASTSTGATSPARPRTASPISASRARSSAPTSSRPSRCSTTSGSRPSPAPRRGGESSGGAADRYPRSGRVRSRRSPTSGSRTRRSNLCARSRTRAAQLELAIALAAAPRVLLLDEPARASRPRRRRGSWRWCARSKGATRSCSSSTRWTSS